MDKKDLFTAGIFLIGFLSLLLVSFNAMLSPIKRDIHRVEMRINRVENRMEAHIDRLNDKLDKLIWLQVQKNSQYKQYFAPKKKKKTKSISRTTSSTTK